MPNTKRKLKYTDILLTPNGSMQNAALGNMPIYTQSGNVYNGNVNPITPTLTFQNPTYSTLVEGNAPNYSEEVPSPSTPAPTSKTDDEGGEVVSSTNNLPKSFEEYVLSIKSGADDAYKKSVQDAEIERQRATLAAGNTYKRALSNYGAQAEALNKMGLQGSGYSRYLDSQAYAQRQADINAANATKSAAVSNAEAVKQATMQEANGRYVDYLNQLETNKVNAYNDLYNQLDALTFGDIERLGAQNGIDADKIAELKTARSNRTYENLVGTAYTAKELDSLYELGYIDEQTKQKLMKGITEIKADDIDFLNTEGNGYLDYGEAKESLDDIMASGISDETKKELQSKFDSIYKAKTAGVTFKKDGGLQERIGTAGNNIKLKGTDENGNEVIYRVQYSGAKGDDTVKAAATSLKSGDVFMYQGVIYLKQSDGECYVIEARPFNSNYTDLTTLFQ